MRLMPTGMKPMARPWTVRPTIIGMSEALNAHTSDPTTSSNGCIGIRKPNSSRLTAATAGGKTDSIMAPTCSTPPVASCVMTAESWRP